MTSSNFGRYCPACGTNHDNTTAACPRIGRTTTAGVAAAPVSPPPPRDEFEEAMDEYRDAVRAERISPSAYATAESNAARQALRDLVRARAKDSERLDWLEHSYCTANCWNVDGAPNNGWTIHASEEDETQDDPQGKTLRDAIDWAMKLNAKGKFRTTREIDAAMSAGGQAKAGDTDVR